VRVRHVFRVNWNLCTRHVPRKGRLRASALSRLVKHENFYVPARRRGERAYYLRDTAHVHFNPSRGTEADNSRGITETRMHRPNTRCNNCLIHRATDVTCTNARASMPPPGYPWVVRHAFTSCTRCRPEQGKKRASLWRSLAISHPIRVRIRTADFSLFPGATVDSPPPPLGSSLPPLEIKGS